MEIKLLLIPKQVPETSDFVRTLLFFFSLYTKLHEVAILTCLPTWFPLQVGTKILAPRQRRPHPTLTAATSRVPLTRKKRKHSHVYFKPTRISSQANEQHRKISPYDTTSLHQARTLANPGSSEFCLLLEKRKSHESGGRRSNNKTKKKRQEAKP